MTLTRENPPAEYLSLLYRVSRALLKEGEYGELLSGLLDTLIEGLGADRGFVVVREAEQFRATAARNAGFSPSNNGSSKGRPACSGS